GPVADEQPARPLQRGLVPQLASVCGCSHHCRSGSVVYYHHVHSKQSRKRVHRMTTEVPIKDHLIGTVSYTRKVGLPNYSSEDAFHALQFEIGYGDDADLIAKKAHEAFAIVKSVVNEELGLAPAVVERAFPGTEVVEQVADVVDIPTPAAQLSAALEADGVGPNPPFPGDYRNLTPDQKKANAEWGTARLATNPEE